MTKPLTALQQLWKDLNEAVVISADDIVKRLLERGSIRQRSSAIDASGFIFQIIGKGTTPLMMAVKYHRIDVMRRLLQLGADVKECDDSQNTALHFASERDNLEIMELLVGHGAVIEAQNFMLATPLHFAASSCLNSAKFLLDKGHCVDCETSDGGTPLCIAADSGDKWMLRLLLEEGATCSDLALFACASSPSSNYLFECLEMLLDFGANVQSVDSKLETALHAAASVGNTDLIEKLISEGADRSAVTCEGDTTLDLFNTQMRSSARFADADRTYISKLLAWGKS